MNMDNELREALRRKQAPDDLADRVLTRIRNGEAQTAPAQTIRSGAGSHPAMRWLAAAAVLAVAVGGAERYYTQQQAAEAARVQEELRVALQITNDTLAIVQSKLSPPADNEGR
jgi:hypothetical protein